MTILLCSQPPWSPIESGTGCSVNPDPCLAYHSYSGGHQNWAQGIRELATRSCSCGQVRTKVGIPFVQLAVNNPPRLTNLIP